MPKIGKRILKSSLAVLLCFLIYEIRGEQGIVFYSCIAAVLCVQQSTMNTIKVARNRVEGTLIGGFIGMLILFVEKTFIPSELIFIQYIIISVTVIPIIYITVLLKKTSASYISCVVFLSVCVSHALDVNPFMFALDRMMDTIIGIFVALFVNCVHLPYRNHKDTLFYVDWELLHEQGSIPSYHKVKWVQLVERGATLGILTKETPARLLTSLSSMQMKYPLLCLDGATLYDIKEQTYHHMSTLPIDIYHDLYLDLKKYGTIFTYSVVHNVLHIYYDSLSPLEETYYNCARKQPYENYVYAHKPKEVEVLAIMLVNTREVILTLKKCVEQKYQDLHLFVIENEEYTRLYITNMPDYEALKRELLKQSNCSSLHVIHHQNDSDLEKLSDIYHVEEHSQLMHYLHRLFHPIFKKGS